MKFKKIAKNSLFYNQYKYCITWHLPHAHMLRQTSMPSLLERLYIRNSNVHLYYKSPVKDHEQEALIETCEYLNSQPNPFRKSVNSSTMWIYTNHPDDFKHLGAIEGSRVEYCTEADVCLQPGVVTLNNPQHQYRTYFKDRWLSREQLASVVRYFSTRSDQFRMAPSFQDLVAGRRMWMTSNHFVDHNEPGAELLINLACPGLVRKTLPIVARAK